MSPKISDEQREQRRQQLLQAAERVFIRKGYEPSTMKDFVEEAEMSRGWIYLYFQTKEEIFEAIMEQHDQQYDEVISKAVKELPNIWAFIELGLNQVKQDLKDSTNSILPTFYEYYLTGWRDEHRRKRLVKRYENGTLRFIQLLQLGVDQGEFTPAMPLEIIGKLTASYQEGIIIHTLTVGFEMADTEKQLDALSTYLRQLLGIKND